MHSNVRVAGDDFNPLRLVYRDGSHRISGQVMRRPTQIVLKKLLKNFSNCETMTASTLIDRGRHHFVLVGW